MQEGAVRGLMAPSASTMPLEECSNNPEGASGGASWRSDSVGVRCYGHIGLSTY